jgi:hypothetical protein
MKIIQKRPWLLIVFAFVLLISAWSSLIMVAAKHRPESIELPQATHHTEPADKAR